MVLIREQGITCFYKGIKKNQPKSMILIDQAKELKSISMFENPEVRQLIEEAGHIYESSVITSYFWLKVFIHK